MAAARRTWRSIKREYARSFPHQVSLPNAGGWRTDYTNAALQHLPNDAFRWWTEGGCSVWGFKSIRVAVSFEAWATSCGIDWTVPPAEQSKRPPRLRVLDVKPLGHWQHLSPGRRSN